MVRDGDKTDFLVKETGSLYFKNRLCVPYEKDLMYQDLKQHYW